MKAAWVLALSVLLAATSAADERSLLQRGAPDRYFTGNLSVDLFAKTELANSPYLSPDEPAAHSRKSPFLAAGLSLAVPGAGQWYTGRYWEAVAFFAADVAAWVLAANYDKKGDRQTDFFQNFADANWSVVDYAQYAEDRLVPYIPDPDNRSFHWLKPGTEGLAPWLRVDWGELNRMERAIGGTDQGRYYSHTLPPHGDQQYYELIGKYQQFNQGWNDRPETYTYGDPVTANFKYYSVERGKANDYYATATTWVTVAIINHIVSGAYAALNASWYNKAQAELGMQKIPSGNGYTAVPVVKMRFEF